MKSEIGLNCGRHKLFPRGGKFTEKVPRPGGGPKQDFGASGGDSVSGWVTGTSRTMLPPS